MRLLALLAALPLLAGCAPLDAVEGKSPGQEYVLRLTAMEAEMASLRAGAVVEAVVVVEQPAPVEVCVVVFRVENCEGK